MGMTSDVLRTISSEILEFVRDSGRSPGGFLPGEETLTEMVLVGLKRQLGRTSVIEKPSRLSENREGHDWVWTLRTSHGYGTMRVQAKKLYASGKYDVLNHSHRTANGSVELQLERLINASRAYGHVPVYAFYNGDFGVYGQSPVSLGSCCQLRLQRDSILGPSYSPMGVTLTDAHWIRGKMAPCSPKVPPVPRTTDINSAAFPWECLFSCQSPRGLPGPGQDETASHEGRDSRETNQSGQNASKAGKPGSENPRMAVSPKSYLQKLVRALQEGEVTDGMTGFSETPPIWLQQLQNGGGWHDNFAERTVTAYNALEPDLDDGLRPTFYVFSDMTVG